MSSSAWTAKLLLTAGKLGLASCCHDALRRFAFSLKSWLLLCQLESLLLWKLNVTQKKPNTHKTLLSPFQVTSLHSLLSNCPRDRSCSSGLVCRSRWWVLLQSLSGPLLFPISPQLNFGPEGSIFWLSPLGLQKWDPSQIMKSSKVFGS